MKTTEDLFACFLVSLPILITLYGAWAMWKISKLKYFNAPKLGCPVGEHRWGGWLRCQDSDERSRICHERDCYHFEKLPEEAFHWPYRIPVRGKGPFQIKENP